MFTHIQHRLLRLRSPGGIARSGILTNKLSPQSDLWNWVASWLAVPQISSHYFVVVVIIYFLFFPYYHLSFVLSVISDEVASLCHVVLSYSVM